VRLSHHGVRIASKPGNKFVIFTRLPYCNTLNAAAPVFACLGPCLRRTLLALLPSSLPGYWG